MIPEGNQVEKQLNAWNFFQEDDSIVELKQSTLPYNQSRRRRTEMLVFQKFHCFVNNFLPKGECPDTPQVMAKTAIAKKHGCTICLWPRTHTRFSQMSNWPEVKTSEVKPKPILWKTIFSDQTNFLLVFKHFEGNSQFPSSSLRKTDCSIFV